MFNHKMSLENLDLPLLIILPNAGLIRAFNIFIYVVNFQERDSEVFHNLFDPSIFRSQIIFHVANFERC